MRYFNRPTILFNKAFSDDALIGFCESMKELEEKEETEVAILINSPGGAIDVLKTMLDYIYHTEMHVTTVVSGIAASCGCLLAMAGDHRVAFPGALYMSHMYSAGARGKHNDLKASRVMQDQTYQFMIDHYKLHTGLSEAVITKELLPAEDVWLTAEKAVKFNLVDSLIDPLGKPIGFKAKRKYEQDNVKAARIQAKQLLEQTNRGK